MISAVFYIDKFISLVKNRPAIYDHNLREHNDVNYVKGLWKEVAQEMNSTVPQCRNKWMSLRSILIRQMQNERDFNAGKLRRRRKRWYLAHEMAFLENLILSKRGPVHKTIDAVQPVECRTADANTSMSLSTLNIKTEKHSEHSTEEIDDYIRIHSVLSQSAVATDEATQSPAERQTDANEIENNSKEYFDSNVINQEKNLFEEQTMTFFKSIMPDIVKLSSKRQRLFKQDLLLRLNEALDEQEMESK